MATVGSLLLVLRADTAPFARSFKGAEDITGKFSSTLVNKIIGSAAVIKTLDSATDALADSLEAMYFEGASAFDGLIKAGEEFAASLQQIPVAGGIGRSLGLLFDPLFGSPMAEESERNKTSAAEDAAHAQRQAEARQAVNKANRDATSIIESVMTAQEKHNATVARATELLAQDRITRETYNRVIAQTPEVLDATGAPLNEMIAGLQRQAATIGMTARQVAIYDAAQQGAGEAAQANINIVLDQIDAANRLVESQRAVAAIFEATRTPLEQYEATIGRLNDLLGEGLSEDVYARAVKQAREQLESAVGRDPKRSSIFALGSNTTNQGIGNGSTFTGRNVIDRTQDEIKDTAKKQLDLTQKEYEQLQRIDESIRTTSVTVQEITI